MILYIFDSFKRISYLLIHSIAHYGHGVEMKKNNKYN